MIAKPKSVLEIKRWYSGLYTQRSPLVTPVTVQGINVLERFDTLIDGLNMELSNKNTLERRPGFTKQCSVTVNAPLAFASFRNNSDVIKLLLDNGTAVQTFDAASVTTLYTKGSGAQTHFQTVGNYTYMSNGSDHLKWDGTTLTGWGIFSPVTAPTYGTAAGALSPVSAQGYKWVYVYKNSSTGHISTASPVSAASGPQTSKQFNLTGSRSTDAQVDKVDIYRTMDGGGVYYFVAEIANPGAGSWTYSDNNADSTLNTLLLAPLNHSNDPPPAGTDLVISHANRLWVSSGNAVYFAGGPDIVNGIGDECFAPANKFVFPGKVTAFASTSAGLLVFTASNTYIILGANTISFYSKRFLSNFGVLSQNCVVQDGDLIYVFTSYRQLFEMSDTLTEVGFDIGDKLEAFDPAASYMALHRSGKDGGLFVGNGSDSIYRYNLSKNAWSPVAQPVGGVKAIASIATATSTQHLVMGRATNGGYILYRDTTTWADDTTAYSAYATVGSLVAATLGNTSDLEAVLIERVALGTDATVAILVNEISGLFTTLPNPVAEPPLLVPSTTVIAKRHYLKAAATPVPQKVHHCQVKITFPTENAHSELYTLALMPPNA